MQCQCYPVRYSKGSECEGILLAPSGLPSQLYHETKSLSVVRNAFITSEPPDLTDGKDSYIINRRSKNEWGRKMDAPTATWVRTMRKTVTVRDVLSPYYRTRPGHISSRHTRRVPRSQRTCGIRCAPKVQPTRDQVFCAPVAHHQR